MSQYLLKKDFDSLSKYVDQISNEDLISNTSYDETELLTVLDGFSDDVKLLLAKCSIHIALIGAGGQSFGRIKEGEEILEITDIFNENNISHSSNVNSKYEPNELTSRRLVRLFRYLIKEYIIQKDKPSYLWIKYSSQDIKYKSTCFPGAEHLIQKPDEAKYLLETYQKLDEIKETNFCDRVKNIFKARGIKY